MKYINKYSFDSNLLHEECKKLYSKPHKLLITHEVLYTINNHNKVNKNNNNKNNNNNRNNGNNNNNGNNKTIYEKILNLLGCY